MTNKLEIIKRLIYNLNWPFFVLLNILLILALNIGITSLPFAESITNVEELNALKENNAVLMFFAIIILGPLFETMVFQAGIIRLSMFICSKIGSSSLIIPILISASLFAANHMYNITYLVLGFLVGLVFATSYVISMKRYKRPELIIFIIHASVNFVPFARDFIL
jgi:membrane protease YdiL (CAAX protease family)